jgi:predicted flap endonuclease-1-like 5' DNA nuclease
MLTWISDYWYLCLIALLIGLATGWWIWGRLAAAVAPVAAPVAAPLARMQPVAAPLAAVGPGIAPAVGESDDLELIKGVGPALNTLLIGLGVRRFDQIAAWTSGDIAEVDQHLGAFKGRIERDHWVDQAGYLARGDKVGFETKYGSLGSEIDRG